MLSPAVNGPEEARVFTRETSAEGAAVPPLPVLSVLLGRFGSDSAGVAVAVLSNAPAALIVAVKIGRAAGRGRVEVWVVGESLKNTLVAFGGRILRRVLCNSWLVG